MRHAYLQVGIALNNLLQLFRAAQLVRIAGIGRALRFAPYVHGQGPVARLAESINIMHASAEHIKALHMAMQLYTR